ncbi:MAG: hypothetical protein K8F35_09320 [Dokdonella sp.]|uniref:hypothetical protein n=1 Tax=Dokdonella sp. TaxID=2291710 RepID=UPI0025BE880E|nr:hypothetical protein [Dokdonella sp.]MBZ0223217.1 hypothetical protein [Dokdonella sp.]
MNCPTLPLRTASALRVLLLAVLLWARPHALATEPETELEPVIDAASLIEPALLSGPGFNVDAHVELRGYMAHFRLDTRLGPMQAPSVEILAEREAELPALELLDAATHSQAFIDAASDRLLQTAHSLANIALHPIDTVTGVPLGVARFLRDKLVRYGDQAQSLSDHAARRLGSSGNPWQASAGPMTEARHGDDSDAPPRQRKTWLTRISREGERWVKRELKYNTVKRDLARRLGIDPYSGNPLVQERLSSLAWIGSAGNFSAGKALDAVGGVGAQVLAQGGRIDEVVWRLSPDDLRARNAQRLQSVCRDEFLIRQFLRRGAFTPTLQTALVDHLQTLQPESGCDLFLELAMTAQGELEARFLANGLGLIASHLGARARGGQLLTIGAGFAWRTRDGEIVLPLAVDRLSWTVQAARFFTQPALREGQRSVLIDGDASVMALRELRQLGWRVTTHAPRAHAPPYARKSDTASDSSTRVEMPE